MNALVFNSIGILLIIFIVWWFLVKKPKAKNVENGSVEVLIKDGVYQPASIHAKAGKELTINFLRKDESPCSEYVIFDDFNISAKLPLNEPHAITLKPEKPGKYPFTCQMKMYRGELIVG
jgi:plastocyanin domain-containing protein